MVAAAVPPLPSHFADLESERRFLWGVCYRMTGSAEDADDLVQETFVRAMERPPADTTVPWRPWLVRVAMNLAKDQLRRRKRRGYAGLWLPTPIETPEGAEWPLDATDPEDSPEARYGLMESASFAFLVAVEALTSSQRAVLLLRDVFDYSSREAAQALEMTEENVRITLHRARKAMAAYDGEHRPIGKSSVAAVEAALRQIMACIASRDAALARPLFEPDSVGLGDGGGQYHAGRVPVVGAEKIIGMYLKLSTRSGPDAKFEIRRINGLPALIAEDPAPKSPNGPRAVVMIDLNRHGRVRTLFSVIAPQKLGHVRWSGSILPAP
jgi:RNA polymerase sigma-70 factor (ECF subfamily)